MDICWVKSNLKKLAFGSHQLNIWSGVSGVHLGQEWPQQLPVQVVRHLLAIQLADRPIDVPDQSGPLAGDVNVAGGDHRTDRGQYGAQEAGPVQGGRGGHRVQLRKLHKVAHAGGTLIVERVRI